MNKLKKTQLETEQLKQQHTEAQFEALRNQINPHFLFNSFNVLSSLVYKDADKSAKFIDELSSVYRYLLNNRDKKLVTLKEELDFIDAYLYLLTIRFGDNLLVKKNIAPADIDKKYIAPASLQMLMENAIKHNVVSKKEPLSISINVKNNYIELENGLQEKQDKEPSTNIGLENIKNRYAFLTDRPVLVEKSNQKFIVRLPLLEVENDEHTDSGR